MRVSFFSLLPLGNNDTIIVLPTNWLVSGAGREAFR